MSICISRSNKAIGFNTLFLLLIASWILLSSGCAYRQADTSQEFVCSTSDGSENLGCALVATARSKTGVRYRMGGTDPSTGFDCSGFVCWTYEQNGIQLPRTSREQMKVGRKIPRHMIQPGDVVAFRISRRRGYHTGIYTGNGKFIHSPSAGKTVSESSMTQGYWKNRFVDARRIKELDF